MDLFCERGFLFVGVDTDGVMMLNERKGVVPGVKDMPACWVVLGIVRGREPELQGLLSIGAK